MSPNNDFKNFGEYLDRTLKVTRQQYLKRFKEKNIDLTTEQWVLLDNLYHKGEISQNELAEGTFKNAPTVSRIIDLMCQKGITKRERVDTDRRRHQIHLTKEGKALYERTLPEVNALREQGWSNLTEQDYKDLIRILDKIFHNFSN